MPARRIPFIFVMVACSLLGIFLLQGYWLYNSYQVTEKQFDKEITDVLAKLKSAHAVAEMRSGGLLSTTDTTIKDAEQSLMVYLQSLSSTIRFSQDAGRSGVMELNTQHEYTRDELTRLGRPLQHELDALFRSQGVTAEFAYMVSNSNGKGSKYYSNKELLKKGSNKKFQIRLGLTKPFVLSLTVKDPTFQVLRQMQWILLTSILIIGITIWAFIYMFQTIFRQKKLSEVKRDFMNNMTHEFKTPIATVSLAVEAMKNFDVLKKPEKTAEYLDICQLELKRITAMVERVLRYAAFEQNELTLHPQQTNIGVLISEVAANMRLQLEEKGAVLSINALHGEMIAMIDPEHFSSVLYNLIDNALKYTIKPARIQISYGQNDTKNALEIIISDNGTGIPAAYQHKVFESFFRVPTGDLHEVKGFGLGLSYVAEIVKKLGGTIEIKSVVNQGSSFIIILPLILPEKQGPANSY